MDAIKAIVSKNSITLLILGVILTLIGAISEITIGSFSMKALEMWARILLIFLGIALIILGSSFTYMEYKSNSVKVVETLHKNQSNSVTYRSTIKLIHCSTNMALHSHSRDYHHQNSSKLQQVTGYDGANSDDFWIVKGPHGKDEFYNNSKTVQYGDIIRLEHKNTRKNLRSHERIAAPITTDQQEVAAYGTDGIGSSDDNWRIDLENGGEWIDGAKIRLIHINTNVALHSHRAKSELISNQQEITGFSRRNQDDLWFTEIIKCLKNH